MYLLDAIELNVVSVSSSFFSAIENRLQSSEPRTIRMIRVEYLLERSGRGPVRDE